MIERYIFFSKACGLAMVCVGVVYAAGSLADIASLMRSGVSFENMFKGLPNQWNPNLIGQITEASRREQLLAGLLYLVIGAGLPFTFGLYLFRPRNFFVRMAYSTGDLRVGTAEPVAKPEAAPTVVSSEPDSDERYAPPDYRK